MENWVGEKEALGVLEGAAAVPEVGDGKIHCLLRLVGRVEDGGGKKREIVGQDAGDGMGGLEGPIPGQGKKGHDKRGKRAALRDPRALGVAA